MSLTGINVQVLSLNILVFSLLLGMGSRPLLINGGGSTGDSSVNRGAKGQRPLTLSCPV